MKKTFKQILCTLIAVVMLLSGVPFGEYSFEAEAASTYDPAKASEYALKYYASYNPNYSNYNSIGGDCCNFVSQCLYAGGLEMTSSWYWYSYSNRSYSWTVCSGLKNYLCGTLGCEFINQPTANQIAVGDVLYYGDDAHVGICSEIIDGVPWVCAHNGDDHTSKWTMYFSKYAVIKTSALKRPSQSTTSSLIKTTYPSNCTIKVMANSSYIKSFPCSESTDKNSKRLKQLQKTLSTKQPN